MPQSRRAFTLIEVLVVTVMAAAIMTALVVSIGGTRDRSRDLQRTGHRDPVIGNPPGFQFPDRTPNQLVGEILIEIGIDNQHSRHGLGSSCSGCVERRAMMVRP